MVSREDQESRAAESVAATGGRRGVDGVFSIEPGAEHHGADDECGWGVCDALVTPRVRGSADERHPGTRPPDRWPARRPEERSCSQKLLEASGALIRACLLIIPDFVANLFEKPAQFLVGHAACFDLTAEWLECLVRCSLAADVLLDQIVDVDRQILPNLCGSLGEPALFEGGCNLLSSRGLRWVTPTLQMAHWCPPLV